MHIYILTHTIPNPSSEPLAMAGESTRPSSKVSSKKPSSSSCATSASHRKSRWEPPTTTAAAADHNLPKNAHSSPKPGPTTRSPAQPPNPTPPPAAITGHGPIPDLGPLPPPSYGFHMLERRTIVLADGSVRSYFALPPDYLDFPPHLPVGPGPFPPVGPVSPAAGPNRHQDYWNSLGLDASAKRKYPDEEDKDRRRDGREGFSNQILHGEESRASKYSRIVGGYDNGNNIGNHNLGIPRSSGNGGGGDYPVGHKHLDVDKTELKKAFLRFAKTLNENTSQKKSYLEDGDRGRLPCIACGRSSKDFVDTHDLIMHSYNFDKADLRVDHLGLHKALCVLMGWNYLVPPDTSKAYQFLSADEAAANQDDLLIWPPLVIVHNTLTGKNNFGRMEGLGNKIMDAKVRDLRISEFVDQVSDESVHKQSLDFPIGRDCLRFDAVQKYQLVDQPVPSGRDLGFYGGKSKSMYGREGHLGMTIIKFSGDQAGLKEARRLAAHFEMDNRGRRAWARLQPLMLGTKDDENNPHLMIFNERTKEKKRIFYGHLGTATDLDKIDYETRKRVTIESLREHTLSR